MRILPIVEDKPCMPSI